jgi:hypothetical protein
VALFITFLLSGLWHGAAWTFVLWGAIHGFYQVVERLTDKGRKKFWTKLHVNQESRLFAFWQMAVVFVLCNFALIFFRANSVHDLGLLLQNLFTNWRWSNLMVLLDMDELGALIAIVSLIALPFVDRLLVQGWPMRPIAQGGTLLRTETAAFILMAIVAAWLALLAGDGAAAFIYFQF